MQIEQIVKKFSKNTNNDKELAIQLHNYVRDHINFGFTRYFDQATTVDTLERWVGHCNPQAALLTALFNSAGFESYEHFVLLKKHLLQGCLPYSIYLLLPRLISHSYCDVRIGSSWHSLDSYVIDPPLFISIQKKLKATKKLVGFGSYINATCDWNAENSAFSQAGDKNIIAEDHGRIIDVNDYYRSSMYKNKVLGKHMNDWLKLIEPLGSVWEKKVNSVIHKMRKY